MVKNKFLLPGVVVFTFLLSSSGWGSSTQQKFKGASLSVGNSPTESVENFLASLSEIYGTDRGDFQLKSHVKSLGSLSDRYQILIYQQFKNQIPIYGSKVAALVRNHSQYPVVLVNSNVVNFSAENLPESPLTTSLQQQEVFRLLTDHNKNPDLESRLEWDWVIYAGADGISRSPTYALRIVYEKNSMPKEVLISDASILYERDYHSKVVQNAGGNISAVINHGEGSIGTDLYCSHTIDLQTSPLEKIKITDEFEHSVETDALGNFDFYPTSTQATFTLEGRDFKITDWELGVQTYTRNLPMGSYIWNSEYDPYDPIGDELFAQSNTYYYLNKMKKKVLERFPDYPGVGEESEFEVFVNKNNCCGGYYTFWNEVFLCAECPTYRNGGGNSSVILHEYTHHLIYHAGSGQMEFGEGMADVVAQLILNSPGVGRGFKSGVGCDDYTRSPEQNSCHYNRIFCSSCGNAPHNCGKILSGSIWAIRSNLIAEGYSEEEANEYLLDLSLGATLLHVGNNIDSSLAYDFLILDDDNGDLSDLTPHTNAIEAGFASRGLSYMATLGDLNSDFEVDTSDLLQLLAAWGTCEFSQNFHCSADIVPNFHVDTDDLLLLIQNWGAVVPE